MKIALVTPFDLVHPGGVAEHVTHLREEFRRLGHDVAVLAPRAIGSALVLPDRDGFHAIGRAITLPTNGSRARITLDLTRFRQVRTLLRRERFDIVHVHAPLTPALTWMALLGSETVNVATFHAFRDRSTWYRALAPLFGPVVNRLDARIAVSEPARSFIGRYFQGDYAVVPNGIDLDRFGPHVAPFPWAADGSPRILFVGRHDEPRKGLTHLLRAFPAVRAAIPGARLLIVGEGDTDAHESALDSVGRDGIDFVGMVSPAELPRYYASCDVFCAPSTGHESFGIILLEAMASGKAVVASNIPGYASVMTHGREGMLVSPENPAALGRALVQTLSDSAARAAFGAAGRITAETYAWPRVAAQVIAVYEQAKAGFVR